jgi:hypothetical protein
MNDPHRTFLAAGQRWARPDLPAWRADLQLTILQIVRDAQGILRVTYRCPDDEEVIVPAAPLEVAVAVGELVPVAGAGLVARC